MHADEAIGPLGDRRHPRDGDRGGVAGEDRLRPADAVEAFEEVALRLEVLGDSLDHEVGPARRLKRRRRVQPGQRLVALCGFELAFLDETLESLLDVLDAAVDEGVVDLADRHVEAMADRRLRDPRAHQAGAGNVELFDRHAFSFSTSRAITNRWISLVPS